jgi:hypothetical protein
MRRRGNLTQRRKDAKRLRGELRTLLPLLPSVQESSWCYYRVDIDQFCEDSFVLVLVLVLMLEWKRSSGLRRLHVGLVGIVMGSGLVPLYTKPSSTSTIWLRLRLGELCVLPVHFAWPT